MKRLVIYLGFIAMLIYLASSVVPEQRADVDEVERMAREGRDVPIGVELPAFTNEEDELIIEHTGFTLSYNLYTNCPNWVAWELTAAEVETDAVERSNKFRPDNEVPPLNRVETSDYTNSGYNRGHMCPSADMRWSEEAMNDCFLMSNICPQTTKLNGQWWEHVERACRRWAVNEGSVYICCGPLFDSDTPDHYIGRDEKIRVPDGFFKVILSLKSGHEKAIGFIYANTDERQPMQEAAVTVDRVEELTGYDFFASLPDEQEALLESQCKLQQW